MSSKKFDIHRTFYSEKFTAHFTVKCLARMQNVWRKTSGLLDKLSGEAQTNFAYSDILFTAERMTTLCYSSIRLKDRNVSKCWVYLPLLRYLPAVSAQLTMKK